MEKDISSAVLRYKDEILEDIVRLVRIKSYMEQPKDGMPFGEGPAKALEYCLDLGQSFGFEIHNADNYAGHIEFGEGNELLGILAHVDVVPPGDGWTYPPFGGEIVNGRIYGRGTMDDKGEAVAAIYCLKALKDMGIVPKMKIRVIIGAGEEIGMQDMEYYFKKQAIPDFAFSPDSEYPICNREKGILHIGITGKGGLTGKIIEFSAGTIVNAVPVNARALIRCSPGEIEKIESAAKKYDGVRLSVNRSENDIYEIICYGKAAHASEPEKGVNAAAYLIKIISDCLENSIESDFFEFLNSCIGLDNYGERMGADCEDEKSGRLTLNLGIVKSDKNGDEAVLDIRYPISKKSADIFDIITKKAAQNGLNTVISNDTPPLFVPEDSPLIKKLANAYKTVTKNEAALFSTGGGTYARTLQNKGVAFGAGFNSLSYYNIHSADEFLEIEEFMTHCRICLQAIYDIGC